jgi:uncharacterized protein
VNHIAGVAEATPARLKPAAPHRYNQGMENPLIVIAGSPGWAAPAEALLDGLGCRVKRYGEKSGYVARLADDHAALVLVDGAEADWRAWVTTSKASQATRRIPVVLVSADPALSEAALIAGADRVIAPTDLAARLPEAIAGLARVQPDDDRARLAEQCAQPLPPQARRAVELFNAGEYYRQHDLFEALWMAEQGPVRDLYRAILQVGIAYYQVTRGNRRGALKMLLRAVQWLNLLPDTCQGVDVARLRADAARVRAALEALPDGDDLRGFDRSLLGGVRLVGESEGAPLPGSDAGGAS